MSSKYKYVIIGCGFASVWAIQGIRRYDKEAEIVVISLEKNYSKPLITYYLGKNVRSNALPYRDDNFFKENNVDLRIGRKATSINIVEKYIALENDDKIHFEKLLIATGGKPIIPPIENINSEGVFTLNTYSEAQKIEEFIDNNKIKQAIVLGGGLIGLKSTEALMNLGISVSIIELADRILVSTFDTKASRLIEDALLDDNCQVYNNDTIEKILTSNGKVEGVLLKSGKELKCQLVIVAIGVRPDLELVKDTGIEFNRGIIVNEKMESSIKDVYAAGDITEINGTINAILLNASHQGKVAGINMAGGNIKTSKSIPMNSVELCKIPTISVGVTDPKEDLEDYEIIEQFSKRLNKYRKIILKDNIMVGVILISDIDRAGIFTSLIRDSVDLSAHKKNLVKDDFNLLSLPKRYRKYLIKGPVMDL